MSTTVNVHQNTGERVMMPADNKRGTYGMLLVIASETALFASLFSAYFLDGNGKNRWAINQPPHLTYAFIMLGTMIVSSGLLLWGERMVKHSRIRAARTAMAFAIVVGFVFLALQSVALVESWKVLTPDTDAYGSNFYAIVMLHDAHVIVGIFIMFCALFLPGYRVGEKAPYKPYHVAAIYWYFCAILFLIILVILYVIPNAKVYGL